MDANHDPDASAEQITWREIADAVRAQLANTVKMMPAMTPSELQLLVTTLRDAMFMEINAHGYDHSVEFELAKTN